MRSLGPLFLTPLVLGVLGSSPAMAQQASDASDGRAPSSNTLDAVLAGHESAVDGQRAELTALLSQPRVRDVASENGIDMGRVASVVAGLSDAEVGEIAPLVAEVAAAQDDGGLGTITISVAAAIIVLLVLILVT